MDAVSTRNRAGSCRHDVQWLKMRDVRSAIAREQNKKRDIRCCTIVDIGRKKDMCTEQVTDGVLDVAAPEFFFDRRGGRESLSMASFSCKFVKPGKSAYVGIA